MTPNSRSSRRSTISADRKCRRNGTKRQRDTKPQTHETIDWANITLNLFQGSVAFGCDRNTLKRGILGLGLEWSKNATYTIRQLAAARMGGEYKVASAKLVAEKARIAELERMQMEGDLINMAEVDDRINAKLMIVRERLVALVEELAHAVNPNDPELARGPLTQYRDAFLSVLHGPVS